MASLVVSAGFTCLDNFHSRKKPDYSRENQCKEICKGSLFGTQLFMPSKICNKRRKSARFTGAKANLDHIPKEFREETLKEKGLMENYKGAAQHFYGLKPSLFKMFANKDSPIKSQTEKLDPESLSSAEHYRKICGVLSYTNMKRAPPSMLMNISMDSEWTGYAPKPRTPPPDLPSLLLDNRVLWIDMPIVPELKELLCAQLLYLAHYTPSKPLYLYINSPGVEDYNGQKTALDDDAYAIMDCIDYLHVKVYTLNLSAAFGQAAMLLARGTKGYRYVCPSSFTKLHLPKALPESGQSVDMWIKANQFEVENDIYLTLLSEGIGKSKEEIANDIKKPRHFTAEAAIAYGIADKIMFQNEIMEKKDYVEETSRARMKRMGGRKRAVLEGSSST